MPNDQSANPNDRGGEGATIEDGNDDDEQTVVKPHNLVRTTMLSLAQQLFKTRSLDAHSGIVWRVNYRLTFVVSPQRVERGICWFATRHTARLAEQVQSSKRIGIDLIVDLTVLV